jgi:hypothetical protein
MQSGFATGTLRTPRTLTAYRITRHPVTWSEYDACVQAGACAAPDAAECAPTALSPYPTFESPNYTEHAANAPAVCVGQAQADAYCRSVGGRLPTLDEWLLAARGNVPQRYAWGGAPSACEQHPMAPQLLKKLRAQKPATLAGADPATAADPAGACPGNKFDGSELQVATHAAGDSPSGLEDVMLTPGELLKSDPENAFTACGGAFDHCVVFGSEPAAIDSVEPFFQVPKAPDVGSGTQPTIGHAYAFRCVLDAEHGVHR